MILIIPSFYSPLTNKAKMNRYNLYNCMAESSQQERIIGNYKLGETIGEGTFGKVKLGVHVLTGERVAIKILVKEKIIDVADVQRVSREIHILKLIRHPSVIQLYEIIETARHLFLIMEYVEKGELFQLIVRNGKLQEEEACRYFKHLVSGVAYLHQLNIVHRDLKPENLLVDWKGGLKIVDFGLSNTYQPGQLLKTACGSPCYAAPEMISSKRYFGLDVDIWSCGVILFAMVCGYLPFQDGNTALLYKKILSGEYVLPLGVSPQFKDLLSKILCIDPSKRAKVQQIFSHKWCQLAPNIPLHSGIIVGFHRIPVDRTILDQLSQFNLDVQLAQRCIQANKHDHLTTTYYLLLKRHLRSGSKSSADIASPLFDFASIQPFKRPQIQKKFAFFGQTEEQPSIQIENGDIRLSGKTPHKHYQTSSEPRKNHLNLPNRSSNYLPQKQALNGRKLNDLKMYLRTNSKHRQFQSQAKRRQDRRIHAQSLHFQSKHHQRQQSAAIRLSTEYTEKNRRQVKSKFNKFNHHQNRFTSKELKQRAF